MYVKCCVVNVLVYALIVFFGFRFPTRLCSVDGIHDVRWHGGSGGRGRGRSLALPGRAAPLVVHYR